MDRDLLAAQLASIHEAAGHLFTWEMPATGETGQIHGTLSAARPDDPRVSGRSERLFIIQVVTSQLTPRPVKGVELVCGDLYYTVQRLDDSINTGQTEILVAAPTRRVED